jgi:rhamnose transport system ATP-binding protein
VEAVGVIAEAVVGPRGTEASPAAQFRGVSKSYGPVQVLADITFDIKKARVHALVGENGAGKSTLVKIMTGVVAADHGELLVEGQPIAFRTPIEARAAGISAVYQDPKLFPHLDVSENIFVGMYPRTAIGTIDRKTMVAKASQLLRQFDVDLDPRTPVAALSMAELQFVEISRALSSDARLLVLDEPTSALTPAEAERLFRIVKSLRAQGKAVLLITHRLEEVEALADDITILRDGRHVTTQPVSQLSRATIVHLMVNRDMKELFAEHNPLPRGAEILRLEGLHRRGEFADVSFSLYSGEIVGMAGLVGAGRSEIAQAIFGMAPPTGGRIMLKGKEIRPRSPRQMLSEGVAYLSEDRDGQGLIMSETVEENVTLPILRQLSRFGIVNRPREREIASAAVSTYRIRTTSVEQIVSALSGGNRQKVAFARWLTTNPVVLLLDEPTHGVDVGSKAQIHKIIVDLAASGLAVLLISSDLPEVLAMSDRIIVVSEGRLVAEFPRAEATQTRVMAAATRTKGVARVDR